jgi:DNA-binding SARP family transcriptional activator
MARVQVRIETLGGFSVRVAGGALPLGRKLPRRPLDLLKYLAVHAGRQLPEGEVTGALWPDREPLAAARSLAVTLHRLRRLLGIPEAIVRRGGWIGVDPGSVWCDAPTFERLLDDAARCGERRRRTALTAAALELYRGDFLAGETRAPWVVPIRARLHERHVAACRSRIRNRSVIRPPLPSDAARTSKELER